MNKFLMIPLLFVCLSAMAEVGGKNIGAMSAEIKKGQWAWTVLLYEAKEKSYPVEFEWGNGEVKIETVCRNANANYRLEDCLIAAKIIFAERCIELSEKEYCKAFSRIKP